ncbi:MAG: hydrogenase maturation nickel metallochaperone HypA [Candidatus Velthaea sp.]|jgi:hydrogenase nickel incorporation protein HypA/HybF
MHELSLAMGILERVTDQAAQRGIDRVSAVHLRVGAMAGVACDSLRFSWELACANTVAAGSQLAIEEVPLVVYCEQCGQERTLERIILRCPECGLPAPHIVRGRELHIVAMEVPDP